MIDTNDRDAMRDLGGWAGAPGWMSDEVPSHQIFGVLLSPRNYQLQVVTYLGTHIFCNTIHLVRQGP